MMEEVLAELMDFVREASPVVWAALQKQVFLDAIEHIVWCCVVSCLAGGFLYLAKIENHWGGDDDDGPACGISWGWTACAALCVLLVVILGIGAMKKFVNPDYYAIEMILEAVRGQ